MVLIGENVIRFSMSNVKDLKNSIPNGNWLIKFDEFSKEFFLEKQDDFSMPPKLFGDSKALAERYINTFNKGNKNLGIALTGLKGTGKSLLAKQTCKSSNLPVLIINEAFCGTNFNSFLSGIKQEAIIFIDEFEKIYSDTEDQESFLSVLDGVFMGKKLFLFTSNEISRYSNYLINRPGRIHYMKKFQRISDDMLNDILNENLVNKSYLSEVKEIIDIIEEANIDMVFALISECNMYKESPKEAIKHLNIKLTYSEIYRISVFDKEFNHNYEGLSSKRPSLSRYVVNVSMVDEEHDNLTESQLEDSVNHKYSFHLLLDKSKFKKTEKGRLITLESSKYYVKISPNKEEEYVF